MIREVQRNGDCTDRSMVAKTYRLMSDLDVFGDDQLQRPGLASFSYSVQERCSCEASDFVQAAPVRSAATTC
jgi:hypothetical protein